MSNVTPGEEVVRNVFVRMPKSLKIRLEKCKLKRADDLGRTVTQEELILDGVKYILKKFGV